MAELLPNPQDKGRTKLVSFSELDAFRQCPYKHHLGYRERWQADETAPALSRGKLFHEVMEFHYNRIQQGMKVPGVAQEMAVSGLLFDAETADATPEQDLVAWIYKGYVEHYSSRDRWDILGVEVPVEDWLPNERGNRSTFRLKGKVDLLVFDKETQGIWVIDHKTCKNLPKGREVDFDDQMAVYIYLLRLRGYDIRGAVFNFCRTEKLKSREMDVDERFKRVLTVRTDEELRIIALEVLKTFQDAYRPREGLPPRHPNTDTCRWRCPFTEPCLGARKGLDRVKMLQDHGFAQDFTRH